MLPLSQHCSGILFLGPFSCKCLQKWRGKIDRFDLGSKLVILSANMWVTDSIEKFEVSKGEKKERK